MHRVTVKQLQSDRTGQNPFTLAGFADRAAGTDQGKRVKGGYLVIVGEGFM